MNKWVISSLLILICHSLTWTQSYPHQKNGTPEAYEIDRSDIMTGLDSNLHTAIRRYEVISKESEESRKGWLNTFYKNPEVLFGVNSEEYSFGINVFFDFNLGRDFKNSETIYANKRGVELFGQLDHKLYFYTAYEENQSNFLSYRLLLLDKYQAIRGKGNYKDYQSRIFDKLQGYDYGFATAYLGYKLSKHTSLEIGHNQHFIGNGIRSLLLSGSSNNYFNVKFAAKFWKIHYQSIFAELSSISARYNRGNVLLPKKYMVNHYLSVKPIENMEIGIYEAIIFSRENHFELQYLNPVIFYRTLEHQLDSPDNVLLGLNGKWNLFKKFSLYGQLLLDEFRVNEFFSGEGWWGNKYALQLGLKHMNLLGVNRLDIQVEYNRVRPFTYSHWKAIEDFQELTVSNYSHYNQPLAHPLGANFTELILNLRYQPTERIICRARYVYAKQGLSNNGNNVGYDILINNSTRSANYGQLQNQGALSTIKMAELNLSLEITRKLYWDINLMIRTDQQESTALSNNFVNTGLRYNVSRTQVAY